MLDDPGAPAAPVAPSAGADRRKYPRYPANAATSSYLVTPGTEFLFPERLHNVSAGGVNLTLDQALTPGTTAVLDVYNLELDFALRREIRVAYSLPQNAGQFRVGCSFTAELTHDELWGLL